MKIPLPWLPVPEGMTSISYHCNFTRRHWYSTYDQFKWVNKAIQSCQIQQVLQYYVRIERNRVSHYACKGFSSFLVLKVQTIFSRQWHTEDASWNMICLYPFSLVHDKYCNVLIISCSAHPTKAPINFIYSNVITKAFSFSWMFLWQAWSHFVKVK